MNVLTVDKKARNCVNALRLSLCDAVTDRDASALLADYRIDDEDILCTWAVAQIFKSNPQIHLPAEIQPRLVGVLRFFQYKNAEILNKFRDAGESLNEKNVAFMPVNGLLLKCLNPNVVQYLWNVELMTDTAQPADRLCYIPVSDVERKILYRSRKTKIFDIDTRIPDDTDALLLSLTGCWNKILNFNTLHCRDLSFFYNTLQWIRGKEIHWQQTFNEAVKLGVVHQIRFVLEMLNDLFPGLLPENTIASIPSNPSEDKRKAQLEILARNRYLKSLVIRKNIQFNQLIIHILFITYVFYQQAKNVLRYCRRRGNSHQFRNRNLLRHQ
ncbi:MAG: hypothetical protein LBR48_09950 [Dysgonamonadaceae bacterium]|nr:hypothetical protein [Dysgonamonadaceae bacterium]